MKRFLALILLFSLILTLSACIGSDRPLVRDEALPNGKRDTEGSGTVTPLPTLPTTSQTTDNGWYIVLIDDTALLSDPDSDTSRVLTHLRKGVTVRLLEEQSPFMHVSYNGQDGWIHGWMLASTNRENEAKRDNKMLAELISRPGYTTIGTMLEMYVTSERLDAYEEPNTEAEILCRLKTGDTVKVYGTEGDYFLVKPQNGHYCYCLSQYLTDELMYATYPGAVDLRALLPEAEFDLLFASANNITGHAMYPAVPLMEETTAKILFRAYQQFLKDGYTIKVYDAYRPVSAQIELYALVQDSRFIANPDQGLSWHQRGRAIDMSLVDLSTGIELEMPTPMHTFSLAAARTNSRSWSEAAQNNVAYMTRVMRSVGFNTISTEWWHFEYLGDGGNMTKNLNYDELVYRPISVFSWS